MARVFRLRPKRAAIREHNHVGAPTVSGNHCDGVVVIGGQPIARRQRQVTLLATNIGAIHRSVVQRPPSVATVDNAVVGMLGRSRGSSCVFTPAQAPILAARLPAVDTAVRVVVTHPVILKARVKVRAATCKRTAQPLTIAIAQPLDAGGRRQGGRERRLVQLGRPAFRHAGAARCGTAGVAALRLGTHVPT